MGPWLNYPIDDRLQNDYYSELFSELSGVNMTLLSVQNNQVPFDKNGSFSQGFRNTGDVNRGDGSVSNVVGGSEYQSEDVEDESLDVKKPTTGQSTSAKRS